MKSKSEFVIQLSFLELVGIAVLIYLAIALFVGVITYTYHDKMFRHEERQLRTLVSALAWPLWFMTGELSVIDYWITTLKKKK